MPSEYTGYPTHAQAIAFRDAGYPVFPVRPDKAPYPRKGHKEASRDPLRIAAWWGQWPSANIGIPTGEVSGLFVLDVDVKHGHKGLDSLKALTREHGELPDTPMVHTASGGLHYYFGYPKGSGIKRVMTGLGDGLEGLGDGYILAPPSRLADGSVYTWADGLCLFDTLLADTPAWLVDRLRAPEAGKARPARGYDLSAIGPGSRNVDLASLAGTLRARGLDAETIAVTLHAHNDKQAEPLPESEIETIAASIGGKAARSFLATLHHTEDAYAKRMALLHGEEIRYVELVNRWIEWDGQRWAVDESKNARMQGRAKAMLAATYLAAGSITGKEQKEQIELQDAFRKAVRGKENKRAIDALIDLTRSEPGIRIRPDDLDSDPMLFNAANGTIDLNTGRLLPHDPKGLITKLSPVAFDPEAACPLWDMFIGQVFDGNAALIAYVRRALGYLLTGDTSEQDFWIAYGGGANGKSTLFNTVLRVLGDYGTATPFTTFDAETQSKYGNDIAALKGQRFVFASEAERERNLAEARVKLVTGQDAISCRFLFGEYFQYVPQFKVWLAVNHKPNIRGVDRGIWRRLKLVHFAINFEDTLDTHLPETLAGELPGILNWLLAGLADWRKIGMDEPECVKAATDDYRIENDVLGQWIEQKCEIGPDYSANATVLYRDYKAWLTENDNDKYPLSAKTFGIQLGERPGVTKSSGTAGDDKGKIIYHGLRPIPCRLDKTMPEAGG
jgi:putative DNA primase/helicase